MAKYYLINNVRVGTQQHFAGEEIDDAQQDAAAITAAGGVLLPTSTFGLQAAAERAQSLRKAGAPLGEMAGLMMAALAGAAVPLASVQMASVTLVAGAATENTLNYTTNSVVVPIRDVAGGSPGALSAAAPTPGEPGSCAISSADAGDTSTVTVLVIG